MHPEAWYAEHDVDLRRGTEATAIDREAHEVELADGTRLGYGVLMLATGSEPRSLPIPGAEPTGADPAHPCRLRPDPGHLRRGQAAGHRGRRLDRPRGGRRRARGRHRRDRARGGRAAAARRARPGDGRGLRRPAPRARRRPAARREDRRDHAVRRHDRSRRRQLGGRRGGGRRRRRPRTALAEAAGLDVDNGVLVDASLRTSDPDIYAVGDIANARPPAARPPDPGRALGQRAQPAGDRGGRDARRATPPTTGCRTSSATSTTSAWSTSATRPATTPPGWWCAATSASASSWRSGSTTRTGSWPA